MYYIMCINYSNYARKKLCETHQLGRLVRLVVAPFSLCVGRSVIFPWAVVIGAVLGRLTRGPSSGFRAPFRVRDESRAAHDATGAGPVRRAL